MAQEPSHDPPGAVELAGDPVVAGLELGGRPSAGGEDYLMEIVIGPVAIGDAGRHPVVARRARQGGEDRGLDGIDVETVEFA